MRSSTRSRRFPASAAWRGRATLPLGSFGSAARVPSRSSASRRWTRASVPTADYQIVSPPYFTTLDLPVVAGRGFDDQRYAPTALPVCIVNEAFVRRYLAGGRRSASVSPCGLPTSTEAKPVVREIVGVARQVKGRPDETEDLVQVYVPDGSESRRRHLSGRPAGVRDAPKRWRLRCAPQSAASTRNSS